MIRLPRGGAARDVAAVGILAAITLALCWGVVSGSRVLYFGDITLYFEPLLRFQRAQLLLGRIPLWDPRILCGTPFVGNPQVWPLYPSSLFLLWMPAARAAGVTGALHLFWAGLGTYLFLRARRVGRGGALFGAISWGFGGALVSKLQFPNMAQAASYLPWLLFAIGAIVERPTPARVGGLAALTGLALLAAHPQMFLMQTYTGAAWTIWLLRGSGRGGWRRVLPVIAGVAIGVALAFGQLLPDAEMALASVRVGLTLAKANRFILPPYAAFYNFVLPNFFGNPATSADYVARGNFWEPCCYAGFLAFCLSMGAATRLFRRSPDVRFWTVAALIFVWLALGRESGLYIAAFHVLPGVAKFHDAARWLQPATFALACLAAYGFDAVIRSLPRAGKLPVAALLLALNTVDPALFSRTLNPVAAPSVFADDSRAPGSRRAYYVDESRLWGRFVSYRSYAPATGRNARAFTGSLGPNAATDNGFTLVNGYEPVRRTRTDVLLARITASNGLGRAALLRETAAECLIGFDPATNGPVVTALIEPGFRARVGGRAMPVRDISPDEVRVSLNGATGGVLVLADTAAPGWHATIDGRAAEIVVSDNGFRSVSIGPGDREVVFRYDPIPWRVGMFVALCASGILFAIGASAYAGRAGRVLRPAAPCV